jgi:hypothetical protein
MRRRWTIVAGAVAIAVVVTASALAAGASGGASARDHASRRATSTRRPSTSCDAIPTTGQRTRIATAKLIIEYNATDEDIGVHGAFDDDGWKRLCVFDPTGRLVLDVGPRGQLLDLTMAGIFFESREPPASEFSFSDLEAAFPEGDYAVLGESFDGTVLVGDATFTHDVPAAPLITSPALAEDPKGTSATPVSSGDLVVAWEEVTETVDGEPVGITGYEVIVTKEAADDPNGFSRPTYDVHVPPTLRRLPVPAGFLEPDTVYELEVLALEVSGNQTISVGFFKTG